MNLNDSYLYEKMSKAADPLQTSIQALVDIEEHPE
jgi:hypothetical protein